MPGFAYEFERDPGKAQTNFSKHGADFEQAATVFRDPLALTIPDEQHSETEPRWITLGDRYVQPKRGFAIMGSSDETGIRFRQR